MAGTKGRTPAQWESLYDQLEAENKSFREQLESLRAERPTPEQLEDMKREPDIDALLADLAGEIDLDDPGDDPPTPAPAPAAEPPAEPVKPVVKPAKTPAPTPKPNIRARLRGDGGPALQAELAKHFARGGTIADFPGV